MARFDANPNFVREWVDQNGPEWERQVGELAAEAISAAAPVRSGFLKQSITHRGYTDAEGRRSIRFTALADYAEAVDQGTGLYGPLKKYITPKRAETLAFYIGGKKVFADKVAGAPGQHFFYRGLSAVFDRVVEHRFGVGG